jgi:hypothetical protein
MKRCILAFAALLALTAGAVAPAKAVEFGVGPGGVYVGHDHYRHYGNNEYGNCRVVIDHHTNRFGEDVTVRRRICD